MNKSIVLLSAGLDSTVNLFLALKETQVQRTITFNYGQRAAEKEIAQSKKISDHLKISHTVVDLPWLKQISTSSLTNEKLSIPSGSAVSIDDMVVSTMTAQSVWVPNRNGVFLNIAASFAEALGAKTIIPGFNVEEAQTFPDNSQAFMNATDIAFRFSTKNNVHVSCFTADMNKTQIMKAALIENVPLDLMWPCYLNGAKWCGQCESCQRTKRAMAANGVNTLKYFN